MLISCQKKVLHTLRAILPARLIEKVEGTKDMVKAEIPDNSLPIVEEHFQNMCVIYKMMSPLTTVIKAPVIDMKTKKRIA